MATPNDGYEFVQWSDGDKNATREISMDEDKTLEAIFQEKNSTPPSYTLTISAGEGGSVNETVNGRYYIGAKVEIIATPQSDYKFIQWSDGDKNATREIVMDADKTLQAIFAAKGTKYILWLWSSEGGTVNTEVNGEHESGASVQIVATPNDGYEFVQWSDGDKNANRMILLIEDITLQASFSKTTTDPQHGSATKTCTWNIENATYANPSVSKGSYGAFAEEQTVTLDGVIFLARNIMRNNNNGSIQLVANQVLFFKRIEGYFVNKNSMNLVSLEVIINSEESFEVSAKADGEEEFTEIELSASDEVVELTSYAGGAVGEVQDFTFRKATIDLNGKNFVRLAAKNSGTPHLYSAKLTYVDDGSAQQVTHVSSVTLDITEKTISAFDQFQLSATVAPNNADDKSVTWSSSNEAIATVDENGLVTALAAGNVDITVKSVDGEKTDVCKLTVAAAKRSDFVLINPANLQDNDTVIITMTVDSVGVPMLLNGAGATAAPGPKAFAGGVVENSIVPANDNFVFIVSKGPSGFMFRPKDSEPEDQIVLYVRGTSNDGVRVRKPSYVTEAGTDSIGMIWVVDEETGYLKSSYLTNDGEVVRLLGVNSGAFKAYRKTSNGELSNQIKEQTLRLFVKGAKVVPVENVTLDKSEATLKVSEKVQLTATVTPEDATNKAVVWTSADEEIATVDETGLVKAVAVGETTITVTTIDGNKKASAAIKVESGAIAVESVAINITKKTLSIGKEFQLTATIYPADATDKDVTWESSKKSVATVDANGLVKAVGKGEATITVKTIDGGKKATAVITVLEEDETVVIFDFNDFAGQGVSGGGGAVRVEKNGVIFECDKAYGDGQYGVRCYKGGVVNISATQNIVSIEFDFPTISGTYYNGGVDDKVCVGGQWWSETMGGQARMSTIIVTLGEGTCEIPPLDTITVTQALEIAQALSPEKGEMATTKEKYIVQGYVVGISEKNENTFYLADEEGALGEFEAFNCKSVDSEVAEGDYVMVTGLISHYWGEGSKGEYHSYEILGGILEHVTPVLTINTIVTPENSGVVRKTFVNTNEYRLEAIPNKNYHFVQWLDGVLDNPRTIVVTQDTTFTAEFALDSYSISVSSNDNSKGTVTGGGEYEYGSVAKLTAIPETGFQFNGWSDGSVENPHYVSVLGNASYTAYFDTKICKLTVKPNDILGGAVSGGGTFEYGAQVTLTASENSGYQFVKWSNGSTYNPYKFTIVDDMELIAFFQRTEADPVNVDEVVVTPDENSANIQWPQVDNAYTYTLIIWADAAQTEKVCTLVFDASGRLQSINFNKKPRTSTSQTEQLSGFSFTVTGLDENTEYFYSLAAKDEHDNLIGEEEKGNFTTKGTATGVEEAIDPSNSQTLKLIKHGNLYILRNGEIYNATGARVE